MNFQPSRLSQLHPLKLFILILVLAALARLLTFERFLPLTDYPDELNMYMLALDWRDAPLGKEYGASRVGDWLGSYPPLFVWGEMGIQSALDLAKRGRWIAAGEVIFWVRLLAIGFGVLTTALIFDTARVMGGLLAGVIASLAWAIAVPIIEFNSLAIPDPLVYLTCAAALWSAARAFRYHSFHWALVGVIAAIGAIYTKYVPVYALIPPLLAMLWLTLHRKSGALRWWIAVGVIGALSGGLLIDNVTNHPLTNGEAKNVHNVGLQLLVDPTRNWNNLQTMLAPISVLSLALAACAVILVVSRRKKLRLDPFVGTILLYLLPVVPLSALVTDSGGRAGAEIRHVMPGVIALILLWSAGLAFVAKYWRVNSRPWAKGLATLSLIVWLVPTLAGGWALVERFQPPNIIYQLWTWSDENLPADGMILMPPSSSVDLTWNRPWSGYDGQNSFQWWVEDLHTTDTSARYVERGITYYTLTEVDRLRLDSPEFRAFVDQLQPVKTLIPAAPSAGSTVYVYRMLPPQTHSGVVLGSQIELVGYDLANKSADKSISLRLYWQAIHRPSTNYSVFVHLVNEDASKLITQYDGAPTTSRSLTLQWDDPDELHISDLITLQIPPDTAPGTYQLQIGLYDFTTGIRLSAPDGADTVQIPVEIK